MAKVDGIKLKPYEPPFSVISVIESTVRKEELHLVYSLLGESSIEYCQDLRRELEMLLEIWQDIGDQTEPPTVSVPLSKDYLLDPPKAKELLTAQVKLLAKGVQEKNGLSSDKSFQDCDENVIRYAMLSQSLPDKRPSTPLRRNDPEVLYQTSPVKLKQVRKNINAMDIDNVAELVRDAIEKECRALENDIEFLQKSVEEEHENVSHFASQAIEEPPLSKLREVCKTLEAKILAGTPTVSALLGQAASRPQTRINSRPGSSKSKLPTPPSPNRVRLKPLAPDVRSSSSFAISDTVRMTERLASASRYPGRAIEEAGAEIPRPVTFHTMRSHIGTERTAIGPTECWVEPSWTKDMSRSMPGSPDSGVSSRPPTRDLVTIQNTLKSLELRQHDDAQFISTRPRSDLGYSTTRSSENLQNEHDTILTGREREEVDTKGYRTLDRPRNDALKSSDQSSPWPETRPIVKPQIKPRPPAVHSDRRQGRQALDSKRFARKTSRTLRLNGCTDE